MYNRKKLFIFGASMKAIYQPKGKANEYAVWACNFYNGCSGKCEYCYNRVGRFAKVIGCDVPVLKKGLYNEFAAFNTFKKEVLKNKEELIKHGLFFSFVSDPCLDETIHLISEAIWFCADQNIKTTILTKQAAWAIANPLLFPISCKIGFTLTGHDELEPGCTPNNERINTLQMLHNQYNYKLWASIEPIIDFESSLKMIELSKDSVSHYKIGILKGKSFNKHDTEMFIFTVIGMLKNKKVTIYFKDSILEKAELYRSELPESCVDKNYNF